MGTNQSVEYYPFPSRAARLEEIVVLPICDQVIAYGFNHQHAVDNLREICRERRYPDIEYVPETDRKELYCGYVPQLNSKEVFYNTVFLGQHKKNKTHCAFFYWHPGISLDYERH